MSKGTPAKAGEFCWTEIVTTDLKGAMAFYQGLFGWSLEPVPGSMGGYHRIQLGDDLVGGIYELPPELSQQGVPPHWLNYVRVDDVDALAAQVKALGGTLVGGPVDVHEVGRMLVFQDGEGALLAGWQAGLQMGATVHGETHALCWMELMSKDPARATAFYTAAFGWKPKVLDNLHITYTELYRGEQPQAGLMGMDGEPWQGIPPHWMAYILVDDVDASAARAEELGGKLCVPPTDIPKVGRFAVVDDPQGATFAVFRFSPTA